MVESLGNGLAPSRRLFTCDFNGFHSWGISELCVCICSGYPEYGVVRTKAVYIEFVPQQCVCVSAASIRFPIVCVLF